MAPKRSIDAVLACMSLPGIVARIDDQRPAFHAPVVDDSRYAYFLVEAGTDPIELVTALDECVSAVGFVMDYCEKNNFLYRGPLGTLLVHLDNAPHGMSARFDITGRPVEVAQTWHRIPAGRLVVTFSV